METASENKENETRGCLTLNDKVYPVYDGHNTVGRNPDATVNIKHLNVSKHHAIITIIENCHYLSDFKSSNGTLLNNKKLTPLQVYKLNDGASVKFGDVFCTYKKLEDGKTVRKSLEETQELSESFYSGATQEIALPNLSERININELPTQVFTNKHLDINDMPTQIHELLPQDDSSNESIDFMTMQKAESQAVNSHNGVPKESKEASLSEPETSSSQINPVRLRSRKILDDDTDEDPKPLGTAGKKVIDSDSDTEEYDVSGLTKSKYVISDDSETDIDDDDDNLTKGDDTAKNEEGEESSISLRLELSESTDTPNGEAGVSKVKVSKKNLPADHVYCQFTQTQNQTQDFENYKETIEEQVNIPDKENLKDQNNESKTEVTATTSNNDASAQKFDFLFSSNEPEDKNEELAPTEENEKDAAEELGKGKGSEDDDYFFQPTQTLDIFDVEKDLNEPRSDNADEIFLQPTQSLALASTSPQSAILDEIFLLPTQTMQVLPDPVVDESAPREEKEEEDKTIEKINEEDLEDTPNLEIPNDQTENGSQEKKIKDKTSPEDEDINTEECSKQKKIDEIEEQTNLEDEDTPNLDLFVCDEQDNNKSSIAEIESNLSDLDESIFPPTQEPSTSRKVFAFNSFKSPSPLRKKKLLEDDDSFILQPTQALEVLHDDGTHFGRVEDELHDIFASQSVLCTQQLVDVLNTSGDIIDDSIQEDSICRLPSRKCEPLTADSVKKILEDVEEKKEVRTYSKKDRQSRQLEEIVVEETPIKEREEPKVKEKDSKTAEQSQDTPKSGATGKENKRGRRINKNSTIVVEEDADEGDQSEETSTNNEGRRSSRKKVPQSTEKRTGRKKIQEEAGNATDEIKSVTRRGRKNEGESSEEQKSDQNDHQTPDTSKKAGRRGRSKESGESVTKKNEEKVDHNNTGKSEIEETPQATVRVGRRGRSKIESVSNDSSESSSKKNKEETDDNSKEESKNEETPQATVRVGRRGRSKIEPISYDSESSSKKNEEEADDNSKEESKRKETPQATVRVGRRGRSKIDDAFNSTGEGESSKKDNKKKGNEIKSDNKSDASESSEKSEKTDSQSSRSSERIGRRGKGKSDSQNDSETLTKGRTRKNVQESGDDKKDSQDNKNKHDSEEQTPKKDDSQSSGSSGKASLRKAKGKKIDNESQKSNLNTTKNEKVEDTAPKRSGRREQNLPEEQPFTSTTLLESEKRTSKRKKDQTEEAPTTPTKKKVIEKSEKVPAPMKRLLKLPSDNSEDDFVAKVPKLDMSPRKSRQSARKAKNEDDTASTDVSDVSIASTSSAKRRRLSANSRQQKREETVKQTPQPTPERSRRQLKPKVVFTMMDNSELESLIRQLGGSVVDTVDACTVLVTGTVKRSQKLLTAVAQGKPICSPDWLLACKKVFSFLDPWDFLLVDKEAEKKWNFSLKASLERSSKAKLLEDHTFQLIVDAAADVLKGAIEACGGKCVTRNLPKCDTQHLIIVSSQKNKSKYSKIVKQNNRIQVVEAEAIFDGTLRQEFRFDQFLLT